MEWTTLFDIALGAILINNFILAQFLGICPFMGVSKKMETAVGMGFAVIFVMGLASALCYPVNLLLDALDLRYMQTVAFILVIAALVQLVEMFLKKAVPTLYQALGVYLPLITTNCAVLGAPGVRGPAQGLQGLPHRPGHRRPHGPLLHGLPGIEDPLVNGPAPSGPR